MTTEIHIPPGSFLILIAFLPTIAYVLVSQNFNVFINPSFTIPYINVVISGASMWVILVAALVAIIIGSLNAVNTGLNDTGSLVLLTLGTSLIAFIIVTGTFSAIGLPAPYSSYIETFMTVLFTIGVYLTLNKS